MKTKLLRKLRNQMVFDEWWNTYDNKLYIVHKQPLFLTDSISFSKFDKINGDNIVRAVLGDFKYKIYKFLLNKEKK